MNYQCFKEGCKDKVQYVCFCEPTETFSCKIHFKNHIKISNTTHIFDSILSEISEWTKEGILKFLAEEKLKKKKLKHIALNYLAKNIVLDKISITNNIKGFDYDLKEIRDLIIKINQASEEEEDSLLKSLALPPDFDVEKVEEMLPNGCNSNVKLFCRLGQLRNKKLAILNKTNNDFKTEQDFRRTCELYKSDANHWLLRQAYEEYINAYQKLTSLYHIKINSEGINLFKYDIENEEEYVKVLENPYDIRTPFTIKLPNNELFAQGGRSGRISFIIDKNYWVPFTIKLPNNELFVQGGRSWRISFIIDKNYRVRQLPPTNYKSYKKGIYFDRNIYCVGYCKLNIYGKRTYLMRFDLDTNRWIKMIALSERVYNNMIIFNRNILICSKYSQYILLYSIDLASSSTINYKCGEWKGEMWKPEEWMFSILLNHEDRLFAIEYYGWIYESEANDEYTWKKISFSGIDFSGDYEFYCSYNKGGIYFSLIGRRIGNKDHLRRYFNFDLGKKEVIELACYDDDLAIKRLDGRFKIIEDYREIFKLDSNEIKNGYNLYHIFAELKWFLKSDPERYNFLQEKGDLYQRIGWNDEAIVCYNNIIKIDSKNVNAYISKGNSLQMLGQNIEALECYETALRLKPLDGRTIYYKGLCLGNLGRAIEEIECFYELRKIIRNYFRTKVESRKNSEETEWFRELFEIETNPHYIDFIKGVYLHLLKRNDEAEICVCRAIEQDSYNQKYVLYYADVLNDLGKEWEAMNEFNKSYYLMMKKNRNRDCKLVYNCLKVLKRLSKLLMSTLKFNTAFGKLRNSSLKTPKLLKETEGSKLIIKTHNSQLIKRALEYLDLDKIKPIEEIQQISKEILEHRKWVVGIVAQLHSFLHDEENNKHSRF